MKKSDFIVAVAKEAGITRVEAKVTLTGFGTFEVRNRAARAGMNIRTKEKIRIPASKRPVFSAGAVLKGVISGKKAASRKSPTKSSKNGKAKAAPAKRR